MLRSTKRMLVVASLCLGCLLILGPSAWADCGKGKKTIEFCVDAGLDDCAELDCSTPPLTADAEEWKIDARNSIVDHRHFGANDRVQLVVQHLNPFRYDYDFRISSKEIEEAGLANFTKLIFPLFAVEKESSEVQPEKDDGTTEDVSLVEVEQVADSQSEADRLAGLRDKLFSALKRIDELGKDLHDEGEKGVVALNDPQARCDCLIKSAFKVLENTDPTELEKEIEEAESKLEELRETLRVTDVASLSAGISNAAEFIEALWSDVDTASSSLADARSNLVQIVRSRDQIRSTLERGSFSRRIGPLGGDLREYAVKFFRKEKTATKFPSNPNIDLTLTFGSPRFAFAIGAAFADLEQPNFSIEQGFVRDRDGEFVLDDMGNEKLGPVVALTDGSKDRVTPTFFLHSRIHETSKKKERSLSGIYLSIGASGNFDDSATLEYLIGPSFAFAKNKFFVTLGYYNGRVKSLRDGFFEGAELPMGLNEVPVRSDRDTGFAIAFSVKVGSLPN